MNQSFNFDMNIYNAYIYQSGGFHPTFNQYQQFASSIYNNMYYVNLQAQQTQLQQFQAPHQQFQALHQQFQAQHQQFQASHQSNKERISVCIQGMECKNVKCKDYHHPSKDLDILNSSKVK